MRTPCRVRKVRQCVSNLLRWDDFVLGNGLVTGRWWAGVVSWSNVYLVGEANDRPCSIVRPWPGVPGRGSHQPVRTNHLGDITGGRGKHWATGLRVQRWVASSPPCESPANPPRDRRCHSARVRSNTPYCRKVAAYCRPENRRWCGYCKIADLPLEHHEVVESSQRYPHTFFVTFLSAARKYDEARGLFAPELHSSFPLPAVCSPPQSLP